MNSKIFTEAMSEIDNKYVAFLQQNPFIEKRF